MPLQQAVDGKQKKGKKNKRQRRSVPQRTCVGCRTVNPKRAMVRVVRTPDGTVEIDPSGKRPGRGAYICQQKSCWEGALKRRSLEHALKTTLEDTTRAALTAYGQTLPESSEKVFSPGGDEHR